jgi:hypothetical protein
MRDLLTRLSVFIILFFQLSVFSQTVARYSVSSFQISSVNDSVLICGGQAAAGYYNSPQTYIGYLPLDYSLLSMTEYNSYFKVFPNPVTDKLFLEAYLLDAEVGKIQIIDLCGKVVKQYNLITSLNSIIEIDVSGIAKGTYVISIVEEGHIINSEKIIIN